MNTPLKVVQCWDDGVATDARLTDILRKHGAKATFNLNAGLHRNTRQFGWVYQGMDVYRLGWDEMNAVYDGFDIANHSLHHPYLEQIPIVDARREIAEGKDRLEQFFKKRVLGFAYPFGTYNNDVMAMVRDTGHVYARTTQAANQVFPPKDPMAFHPSCRFWTTDFEKRYHAAKKNGVFYFWGHSYEMTTDAMWRTFETLIKKISNDPQSEWANVKDLFAHTK
ncbi:MAG: polysaccharide deacetylase family protein [Deltaproteobacteria bacterium]|nr:polysaccharide deacetylase family protein [Deltaproteobacteria bacterium]